MTIQTTQKQDLALFFADASGVAAFDVLYGVLCRKSDAISTINAENEFLIVAAKIFNESLGKPSTISGKEARAHSVLHSIVQEHNTGGPAALLALRQSFIP